MSDTTPPTDDQIHAKRLAEKRLVGALIMAIGAVIALLCGRCTLVGAAMLNALALEAGPLRGERLFAVVLIPVVTGGLPTAGGVVVFWVGLRLYRAGRKSGGETRKAFD